MSSQDGSVPIEVNRIYNVDCLAGIIGVPDSFIDLTVTSPPYDNLRLYNGKSNLDFWGISKELYRTTKQGGVVVWIVNDATIDGTETCTSFRQVLYFRELGFKLHDTMIWKKVSCYQHKVRYIPSFEYMFIFSKGKPKTVNLICDRKNKHAGDKISGTERQPDGSLRKQDGAKVGRVIKEYGARLNIWDTIPNFYTKTNHPATFPVSLARDHILTWSAAGEIVLDPFMGSGSTAIACIEAGRKYIGFEIDDSYYSASVERIHDFSLCNGYYPKPNYP